MEFYAHTPPDDDPERWHELTKHLLDVADAAGENAAKWSARELGRALGLTHDLAKADPRFQAYLRACFEGRPAAKCPHAVPSAAAAYGGLGPLSVAVIGHHAGMPDKGEAKPSLDNADPKSVSAAAALLEELGGLHSIREALPKWATAELPFEFLVRMLFSALTDADFLDTERHFSPNQTEVRARYPALTEYRYALSAHLSKFGPPASRVDAVREEVRAACLMAAEEKPGAFRLTVPTGGGKTLSGLAFALHHAVKHDMDRVIVAIPYTSIIDQTAQIYSGIFGREAVLEHHSAYEAEDSAEGQSETEVKRRLASENWDCPLVVTTTVQLFESLLSNRPARCRKLHNIARSVILLDEVQTLPPDCLKPILDVLHQLVENYGCTVVFCTATQPDYSSVDDRLFREALEIVPNYTEHFDALKRVAFVIDFSGWTIEDAGKCIDQLQQVLAVFNTRKDALAVAAACRQDDTLFHLSTLMCGHHRKRVIDDVKRRLKNGVPIRLVSTQVVEAGVDLDFPVVMRDMGPLDRIIQVAGRCNREGKLDQPGRCLVFSLTDGGTPRGAYKTFTALTRPLIEEFGDQLDAPEAMCRYFREAFTYTDTGENVQKLRRELRFKTVAHEFRLIDDNTTPLAVIAFKADDVPSMLGSWGRVPPREWFRRLSPFTVSVYQHTLQELRRDGFIDESHASGVLIYTGPYDDRFGLSPGLPDPADLIA